MTLHLILAFDPASLAGISGPADVVVFPELVAGGYAALRATGRYYGPSDADVVAFRTFSHRIRATCIAGSFPFAGKRGRHTNTSLVFHNGRLIHRYDKIHMFRPAGDDRYFTPGRSLGTFRAGPRAAGLRAGIVVCYDLRFPELIRFLAREGMDILFVPARWPAVRDDAWQTLLKARAIENQIFVVGCNAQGEEGGGSYVFGPQGELVFSSRESGEVPYHRIAIDTERLVDVRSRSRYIDDARILEGLAVPLRFRPR
jgi:predicted amidohydrolase